MKQLFLFIACLTLVATIPLQAKSDSYKLFKECGLARVTEGNTCSNVKVEFDLKGCADKLDKETAKQIICTGEKIKARFKRNGDKFEVEYVKKSDGWGGTSWQQLGGVKQWQIPQKTVDLAQNPRSAPQTSPTTDPKVEPVIYREPAKVPTVETPVPPPGPLKVSGFFDFRFSNDSSTGNPTNTYPHASSGFGLEDGAFYLTYEKDKLSVYADIAFRRAKDIDTNTSATVPNQSSNANLSIGSDKSQLYAKYRVTENLAVDVGQFDTIYGVELNDSKDRFFGRSGLTYNMMLPVTHAGAMIEYSTQGAYAKFLAVNPNGKGSYGTSATSDDNTEYGGAIGYANSTIRGQIGYLTRPISKADQSGFAGRNLIDSTAGLTLGRFSLDLGFSIVNDPSKNTLTPSDSSDLEKASIGYLAIGTYKLGDLWSIGVRYENVKNDPAATSTISAQDITTGAHYRLSSELEIRSEIGLYNFENATSIKWNETRFNLATVINF